MIYVVKGRSSDSYLKLFPFPSDSAESGYKKAFCVMQMIVTAAGTVPEFHRIPLNPKQIQEAVYVGEDREKGD